MTTNAPTWRSLSKFAGYPVLKRTEARRQYRRWLAKFGHERSWIQEKDGRWHVVYRQIEGGGRALPAFVASYLEDAKDRTVHSTFRNVRTHLGRFCEWCRDTGIRHLSDITRRHVEAWGKSLPDHLSATSRKRHLESVRAALNRAVDWDLLDANPAARVKMPINRATFQRRALTGDEISVIETQWESPVRQWAMLCLWAGLRRGEATYLAWDDVDLEGQVLAITAKLEFGFSPKGTRYREGAPDLVPLVPWLASELAGLPREGRFVFDSGDDTPLRSPDRWWYHVRKAARRFDMSDDVRPHTLRHTFATQLALAGVSRSVIHHITRHLDAATTDRYIHPTIDDAKREIAKLPNR